MDNYFEHIQDYLDGTLSPEERLRFEEALERDVDLRIETDHQRMLRETVAKRLQANEGVPTLAETLRTVSAAHFTKIRKRKSVTTVRWLIPLAAAACLLWVFTIPGWWTTDYESLPDMPSTVTRGADADDMAREAAKAFNAKAYARSTQLLTTLVDADTTNVRNRYYLGLSYLGEKKYQQSVDILQPVADGTAVYADDARYFVAVALWRLGKQDDARHYATRVTSQSDYHRKARKLADRLMQ